MVVSLLGELRRSSRKLFNIAKALKTDQARLSYKAKLALYSKKFRRTKRSSWRKFCSDIESTSEASCLRKVLFQSIFSLGYLRKMDNSWTSSSGESLDLLLNTHFPGCSISRPRFTLPPSDFSTSSLELLNVNNISWAIKTKGTFIPKAGKPSHSHPKDFGPISLSSFFRR